MSKSFSEVVSQAYIAAHNHEEDIIVVEENGGFEFYTNAEAADIDAPCGLMTVSRYQSIFDVVATAHRVQQEYIMGGTKAAQRVAAIKA